MMKLLFYLSISLIYVCFCDSKVWTENDVQVEVSKIFRKSLETKIEKRPMTAKQIKWWNSLGKRNYKVENKANVKIRKEVRQLTDAEWDRYTSVILSLNSIYPDPDDERTQYMLIAAAHIPDNSLAAHEGTAFLPWHREYLWRLERAIQMIDEQVTIPYMDTSLDRPLPNPTHSVLFSEHLFGNGEGEVTTGPFAHFAISKECQGLPEFEEFASLTTIYRMVYDTPFPFNKMRLFSDEKIATVMNKTTFGNLSYNEAEYEAAHDNVHQFIDGLMMSVPCAPSDPIFFSHHSFIDMIWENFRQHSQVTPLETEYPTSEEQNIGGAHHAAFAKMEPFAGLYNIHGLSTHYTDYYNSYAPRSSYTSCVTSQDCNSKYLWCDTTTNRCTSKVRLGGTCRGLTDEACYGDTTVCLSGICSEHVSALQEGN